MMLDWAELAQRARYRRDERAPLISKMVQVQTMYDGLWVLRVPGTENSLEEPIGPALVAEAIDNMALRCASTTPEIRCPPLFAEKNTGAGSIDYAARRRKALADAWRRAEGSLILSKTYRHLVGYATLAYVVDLNAKTRMPEIRVLDPMNVYPEYRADTDFTPQESVCTIYRRSGHMIVKAYPHAAAFINSPYKLECQFDVCEWHDTDYSQIGIISAERGSGYDRGWNQAWGQQEPSTIQYPLDDWPNMTGLCPIVTLGSISLGTAMARLSSFTKQMELMARMFALELRASQKAVFPDMYITGKDGDLPMLAGGTWKDGSTGQINLVSNASDIGMLRSTPDRSGLEMIDRLERNMRVSSGQSSIMSGEAGSNALRTGRAIDSMMNVSSDPRIAEYQRLQSVAMQAVNQRVLATYKHYAGSKTFTLFTPTRTAYASVEFTPSKHAETFENRVVYSLAGSDADAATIRLGQLVGTEMLSKDSAREMHPSIEDAEEESIRINVQKFQDALMNQVLALAADPQGPITPVDLARMGQLVQQGRSVGDAVIQANKEAQERQAAIAPPPADPMAQATSPLQQPGLAAPGTGQEMQPPPPPPSQLQQTTDPLGRLKSLVQAGRVPYGGSTGSLG